MLCTEQAVCLFQRSSSEGPFAPCTAASPLPTANQPATSSLALSSNISAYPPCQVEATKFTEVGFHGRDVDQIIRDLVDNAVIMMRQVGAFVCVVCCCCCCERMARDLVDNVTTMMRQVGGW